MALDPDELEDEEDEEDEAEDAAHRGRRRAPPPAVIVRLLRGFLNPALGVLASRRRRGPRRR